MPYQTRKLLIITFIWGYLLIIAAIPVLASGDDTSWSFDIGYSYFHVREDLPGMVQDQLESENDLVKLGINYSTGLLNGQLNLGVEGKGPEDDFEVKLKELAWSGNTGKILYEAGKTKWIWGRGLSYIPTCPLDKDTYYWGLQGSLININNNLSIGAVSSKDSYYSNDYDSEILPVDGSDEYYTGWIRAGWIFETSDITTVVSYQSGQDIWNYGFDFSRDLLNGFEIHGGFNYKKPDSNTQYLIGCQYSGKFFYMMEYYHETDDQLVFSFSNSADMFGKWQWELREIYDLSDNGEIRQLNISYIKNNNFVPELKVSMNTGPQNSYFQQNSFDYSIYFGVKSKF